MKLPAGTLFALAAATLVSAPAFGAVGHSSWVDRVSFAGDIRKYMMRDKISIGGTLFVNKIDRFQGVEHDFNRVQVDVEFRFD